MTGNQVKDILISHKKNFSEIARKMGLSPQTLNAKFDTTDIKTGILAGIAKAADIPLHEFFQGEMIQVNESSPDYGTDYKHKYIECLEEKNVLQAKLIDAMDKLQRNVPTK